MHETIFFFFSEIQQKPNYLGWPLRIIYEKGGTSCRWADTELQSRKENQSKRHDNGEIKKAVRLYTELRQRVDYLTNRVTNIIHCTTQNRTARVGVLRWKQENRFHDMIPFMVWLHWSAKMSPHGLFNDISAGILKSGHEKYKAYCCQCFKNRMAQKIRSCDPKVLHCRHTSNCWHANSIEYLIPTHFVYGQNKTTTLLYI